MRAKKLGIEAVPTGAEVPERDRAGPVALALGLYAGLIGVAAVWGLALVRAGERTGLHAPPLFAHFEPRLTWRILPAVVLGAALVLLAPRLAARLSWRVLLWATFAGAGLWAVSLALADGPAALVEPVLNPHDFYPFLPEVGDRMEFLRTYTDRLAGYPIHLQGHPPGLMLALSLLDGVGLATPGVIAAVWIAGGAAAAPAVLVAARALAGEGPARRAAPWLVLAPYALWVATSADALYTGLAAWGIALVVSAGPRDRLRPAAGGVLFGGALMMTYGVVTLGALPLLGAWRRRVFRPLVPAALAGGAVILGFAALGFWWLDGLAATESRYYAGIGGDRPYQFFLLSNLAVLAIACGPGVVRGLLALPARLREGDGRAWLVGGASLAVLSANLSGLSKGEVERIWLIFFPWIVLAASFVPGRVRAWLAASAVSAVAVQVLLVSPW